MQRRASVGGPSWQLPTAAILVACMAQCGAALVLTLSAPQWVYGQIADHRLLVAIHLYGLGLLTLTIMAALLQLVPVVLRQAVGRDRTNACALAGWAVGTAIIVTGLWTSSTRVAAIGGGLVTLAAVPLVVGLAVAVARHLRAGGREATAFGLASALVWFVMVLVLGATMASGAATLAGVPRVQLVAAHAVCALGGWIGGTILAVALRLGPMFALAHGYSPRRGARAVACWQAACVVLVVATLTGSRPALWLGLAGMMVACGWAGAFLRDVARHRRRGVEPPMLHLALGVGASAAAAVAVAFWSADRADFRALAVAGVLGLIGMGASVTSGHVLKVVPMLVWTGRYADRAGTPGVPRLADLYPTSWATAQLVLITAGLLAIVTGIALTHTALAVVGGTLLIVAAGIVLAASAWCVWGHHTATAPDPISVPRHQGVAP